MQYRTFSDLDPSATTVLEGYKGQTFLEKGYVYAPYVPLQMTPVMSSANKRARLAGLKVVPSFSSKRGIIIKERE